MTTLVIGDVHGCARELKRLIERSAPSRVVLVGDLFTKGPDPVGVWKLIRDGGFEAVLGNHDQRLKDVIAGGRPKDAEGAACVAALDAADPTWRGFLEAMPLSMEVGRFLVVHAGLPPHGDLAQTPRAVLLNVRRWPGTSDGDPPWWQAYQAAKPVIFGHDARQGLVRVERDGLPFILGLDAGCVYGGFLCGYVVEEDRLERVGARHAYRPI